MGNKNAGGWGAKTITEHKRDGTFRQSRHAGREIPEPPRGIPQPPAELEGIALAEWDRMVNRLKLTKALSVVDDALLYQYVQLFSSVEEMYAEYQSLRRACKVIRDRMTKSKKMKPFELIRVMDALNNAIRNMNRIFVQVRNGRAMLRLYLIEFGMTPGSRHRIKLPPNAHDDPDKPAVGSKLLAFRRARAAENNQAT